MTTTEDGCKLLAQFADYTRSFLHKACFLQNKNKVKFGEMYSFCLKFNLERVKKTNKKIQHSTLILRLR